jgi:hypothetical protein
MFPVMNQTRESGSRLPIIGRDRCHGSGVGSAIAVS